MEEEGEYRKTYIRGERKRGGEKGREEEDRIDEGRRTYVRGEGQSMR